MRHGCLPLHTATASLRSKGLADIPWSWPCFPGYPLQLAALGSASAVGTDAMGAGPGLVFPRSALQHQQGSR